MFIKYGSTGQFRDAIKHIQSTSGFHSVTPPKVTLKGTPKIHGTNAAVVIARDGTWHVQSRERILTPESDNAGFAAWAYGNKAYFDSLADYLKASMLSEETHIAIYGEWCGGNIQKGVGVNLLPKMFVVFGMGYVRPNPKANPDNDGMNHATSWADFDYWLMWHNEICKAGIEIPKNLYRISEFPSEYVVVDFASPTLSQNALVEKTLAAEKDCPVARHFLPNHEGELVGEGWVWKWQWQDGDNDIPEPMLEALDQIRFKTKGEKHSSSKVVAIAPVDVEKVKSIDAFVEYACTENRLNQGLQKMEELGQALDNSAIGVYIKWVVGDIMKEELDTMVASGIEPKDVNGKISRKAKDFLMPHLNT